MIDHRGLKNIAGKKRYTKAKRTSQRWENKVKEEEV